MKGVETVSVDLVPKKRPPAHPARAAAGLAGKLAGICPRRERGGRHHRGRLEAAAGELLSFRRTDLSARRDPALPARGPWAGPFRRRAQRLSLGIRFHSTALQ